MLLTHIEHLFTVGLALVDLKRVRFAIHKITVLIPVIQIKKMDF